MCHKWTHEISYTWTEKKDMTGHHSYTHNLWVHNCDDESSVDISYLIPLSTIQFYISYMHLLQCFREQLLLTLIVWKSKTSPSSRKHSAQFNTFSLGSFTSLLTEHFDWVQLLSGLLFHVYIHLKHSWMTHFTIKFFPFNFFLFLPNNKENISYTATSKLFKK